MGALFPSPSPPATQRGVCGEKSLNPVFRISAQTAPKTLKTVSCLQYGQANIRKRENRKKAVLISFKGRRLSRFRLGKVFPVQCDEFE